MSGIQLDYSDITEIFKEKLKIGNIVKKISTIFLNARYSEKINYKPYFQRNYVWDDEKATYFIESILLGTEIPPLVFFQTKDKNEIIDGRQRYETIERFLNDKFSLKDSGLRSLKVLAGKKYSQLDSKTKELFEDTRIRILQCSVVDEPKLEEEKEDKIKKEIFRRYNSGISPLQKEEIERAAYINDHISNRFGDKIYRDDELFEFLCKIILPKSKIKAQKRDKINILVNKIRTLITLPSIPIYSYAHGSSKSEIIRKYYYSKVEYNIEEIERNFDDVIVILKVFEERCSLQNSFLSSSKLFFEVLYWGVKIILENGFLFDNDKIETVLKYLNNSNEYPEIWEGIINVSQKCIEMVFDPTGSHYYSAINNRYNFISNILKIIFPVDFSKYMKDTDSFNKVMNSKIEIEQIEHYKLNKPLPETLTIEDIIADMKKSRFLVRPNYQRSEVTNIQKASYLMESILLGINIPPIFIFKRDDKIKEVIDGQQRLLTILGFLGKTYIDEHGKYVSSNKDKFKLTKLRILSDLNGENIDKISPEFENKILEFPMDVIEIDAEQNPDFSQTDLFLRLNTKPYPIKENTFEMWNAYIDKEVAIKVKELARKYEGKIFKRKDTRMKVEELITSLAYIDYKMSFPSAEIINVLNVYKKYDRICARIMSKDNVTKTLESISNGNAQSFIKSVENVELFIEKIKKLIDENYDKIRELFAHSRKGTQYKTDQNFYFLWVMLKNIAVDEIDKYRNFIFDSVALKFSIIQKTPESLTIDKFLEEIKIVLK